MMDKILRNKEVLQMEIKKETSASSDFLYPNSDNNIIHHLYVCLCKFFQNLVVLFREVA